jgi:hypothetical protein
MMQSPMQRLVRNVIQARFLSTIAFVEIESPALTPRPVAVTAENIERALDRLSQIMKRMGKDMTVYSPIYARLEKELAALAAEDDQMSAVLERARRSRGRTAARLSS